MWVWVRGMTRQKTVCQPYRRRNRSPKPACDAWHLYSGKQPDSLKTYHISGLYHSAHREYRNTHRHADPKPYPKIKKKFWLCIMYLVHKTNFVKRKKNLLRVQLIYSSNELIIQYLCKMTTEANHKKATQKLCLDICELTQTVSARVTVYSATFNQAEPQTKYVAFDAYHSNCPQPMQRIRQWNSDYLHGSTADEILELPALNVKRVRWALTLKPLPRPIMVMFPKLHAEVTTCNWFNFKRKFTYSENNLSVHPSCWGMSYAESCT